jgi:hypothetical protein
MILVLHPSKIQFVYGVATVLQPAKPALPLAEYSDIVTLECSEGPMTVIPNSFAVIHSYFSNLLKGFPLVFSSQVKFTDYGKVRLKSRI